MIPVQSLTGRLLLALILPLIVSAFIIGGGGAWVIERVVDYTSDRLLAGSVHAIAETVSVRDGTVSVDLPPWSLGLLDSPQRDSVYYSVRNKGRTLTGYNDLPNDDTEASVHLGPVFRTLIYEGHIVRQAAEAVHPPGVEAPIIVSVAQTMDSRRAVRRTLITEIGSIEAGLLTLVALFIWPAVVWSLRPLEGLRRQLAIRSDTNDPDFTPVATRDVPNELRSVVVAFNAVLERLERSVEGVRRFTADASHQMRTPIAILKTHLQFLNLSRRSASDRASMQDALEAIDRLQRLIEQLLALARADSWDGGGERGSLLRVANRVIQRHRFDGEGRQITLEFDDAMDTADVAMHNDLLDEIVDNLVDNAIRYGGPRIELLVKADAGVVSLDVVDNGEGMSPKLEQRAFERFVRGSGTQNAGSGLGLSIVRALVTRHGGNVSVSHNIAGNFCIRVKLPRAL